MKIVAFLLVFFGILLAMRWWNVWQAAKQKREQEAAQKEDARRAAAAQTDAFVRCARCDAHVPRRESLFADGKWKCLDSQCASKK